MRRGRIKEGIRMRRNKEKAEKKSTRDKDKGHEESDIRGQLRVEKLRVKECIKGEFMGVG